MSLRGADLTITRYISHLDNDTQKEEIDDHLKDAGIDVVELKELDRRHSRFKSFILTLKKSQLPIVENALLWPEGVIVRPFFRPKAQRESELSGESAVTA